MAETEAGRGEARSGAAAVGRLSPSPVTVYVVPAAALPYLVLTKLRFRVAEGVSSDALAIV